MQIDKVFQEVADNVSEPAYFAFLGKREIIRLGSIPSTSSALAGQRVLGNLRGNLQIKRDDPASHEASSSLRGVAQGRIPAGR